MSKSARPAILSEQTGDLPVDKVDPFGQRLAKGKYYDEDFIVSEVAFEAVRRKRTMSPLLRDEDMDLTINELMRIRERPAATKVVQKFKSSRVQGFRKPKKR